MAEETNVLPALFVSHGAPTLAVDDGPDARFLRALGKALGKPAAVVVISAHWEEDRPTVGAAPWPETMYDFTGFDRRLYDLWYPAAGAAPLAQEIENLLTEAGEVCGVDGRRGLDHGAWVPLSLMFPNANVPVAQLSLVDDLSPARHYRIGAALRPLRERGVLILGSGGAAHNLAEASPEGGEPPEWAQEFTGWLAHMADKRDVATLLRYRELAPYARLAHPRDEHLMPLFVALGAGAQGAQKVWARRLHSSFSWRSVGMDAYAFAPDEAAVRRLEQAVQEKLAG